MPITASAKKALRQSVRRRTRNLARKQTYKQAVKSFRELMRARKFDGADAALAKVYQALDKAAKTGAAKKNKASRLKARLAQLMAKSAKASS